MLDLLITPIAAALVILSIHAYLGLHVIARGVIFVDLAFAQIAAMGSTVALLMGAEHGSALALTVAFTFTLVGALVFSFSRMEDSIVPQEAVIGITYVVASAAVLLLASFTAEGAEHVSETLTGHLIWVDWPTVLSIGGIYAAVGAFHIVFRKQMLSVSFAPSRVQSVPLWDFLFYTTFGIVITFSVSVAGVLLVFSALVIPAVIAFLFTNRLALALMLAWASGSVAIVVGILGSFALDVATGPLLVVTFGALLLIAFALRPFFPKPTGHRVIVKTLEL